MLVGGFFLIQKMDISGLEFMTQNGWAIGLIIGGILILCKTIRGKHIFHWHWEYDGQFNRKANRFNIQSSFEQKKRENTEGGYIDYNYVFSGNSEKIDTKEFKGGEVNCVFGGMELDLSDSQLAEGNNYLEINSVFGGIVLYIPIDWKVEIRQNHVFGNFEDHRPKPGFEVDENRLLIIQASSVFGGGEVKCKNQ
jgi:predicted membrane protein